MKEYAVRPDQCFPSKPLLFDAIGPIARVIIGSVNPNKLLGANKFFDQLQLEKAGQVLLPEAKEIYGEEAEWGDAVAVVASKIYELKAQMAGEYGGRALVLANDVVFLTFELNKSNLLLPKPQRNLSRYGNQAGAETRKNAYNDDVAFYGNEEGSLVCWDTVVGMSTPHDNSYPGLQVMLANRHLAILNPIPKGVIEDIYSRDGKYKKINPRLDLVGKERDFINCYGFIPMKATVNGNGFKPLKEWGEDVFWVPQSDPRFKEWEEMVRLEIIYGAPFGIQERVDELLNFKPKTTNPNSWTII